MRWAPLLLLVACKVHPTVEPPVVVVIGGDAGSCEGACANLRAAHCPEGEPSPRTRTPCEAVCGRAPALFAAGCIAGTDGGLDGLKACGVRCVP